MLKKLIRKTVKGFFLAFFSLVTISLTSCQPSGPVTFTIPVSVENFNPEVPLSVTLYDESELDLRDRQAKCIEMAEVDAATGEMAIQIKCPEGVIYQEPDPEVFTFTIDQALREAQFTSSRVEVGDKYFLIVSGQYKDRCNHFSGQMAEASTARQSNITVEINEWVRTLMLCTEKPSP